jgi:hypothetical protein
MREYPSPHSRTGPRACTSTRLQAELAPAAIGEMRLCHRVLDDKLELMREVLSRLSAGLPHPRPLPLGYHSHLAVSGMAVKSRRMDARGQIARRKRRVF